MHNPSVSISNAADGVCFLCGDEGPVFETSTSCGRLAAMPLCSKDLFVVVSAQNRLPSVAGRSQVRSRGKLIKNRVAGAEDNSVPPDGIGNTSAGTDTSPV